MREVAYDLEDNEVRLFGFKMTLAEVERLIRVLQDLRRRMIAEAGGDARKVGRVAGGHARAAALTAQERSTIASKAANARWNGKT